MDIPDEYKKGYTEFLGCRVDLRYRPLIPRIETAEWVKVAISKMDNLSRPGQTVRCLDMFAGSGCVGVAVLKHFIQYPNVTVDFVDISPRCLKQIEINCELNRISRERYRLICSNMFGNLCSGAIHGSLIGNCLIGLGSDKSLHYNFILANPPYCLKKNVDSVVLTYEPKQAVLGGGKDGLRLIKKFLRDAHKYVRSRPEGVPAFAGMTGLKEGVIYMEFDDFQKPLIEKLLQQSSYKKWEFKKDQFGCWRSVSVEQ